MENKVFCKMRISNPRKIWYNVFIAIAIVSLIMIILSIIPVRKEFDYVIKDGIYAGVTDTYNNYYNIFGDLVREDVHMGARGWIDEKEFTIWYGGSFLSFLLQRSWKCVFIYSLILSISLMVWYALSRAICKRCTLELNQDGVYGKKKRLFSLNSINQPFEKIDNVSIRDSIIDKILGGQTLVIRSSSSCIKFSCVDNAQEFLDKTLEELKKYKEAVNSKSEKAAPTSSDGDTMEAIVKLKNLLDQGLITQEEFDSKRKSLIDKI